VLWSYPSDGRSLIRRLYRTRPEVLRKVLLPLLTPQSAAILRLEEILAEEDEAELARSKVEWLERFHNAVRDDALIADRYVNPAFLIVEQLNTLLACNRRIALKSGT
jgi:type VI protein secretion system component VasF